MDRASIIGIVLGIAAVVGGNFLEGGKTGSLLQPASALIVLGGTVGATLLSFPLSDVRKAIFSLKDVFFDVDVHPSIYIERLLQCAVTVRREGVVALERELPTVEDAFFRKALTLAVDQLGPKALRDTMEQEIITYEEERRRIAMVFDTAGGFAPTIGILGAVLGLIHVMENLANPAELGSGIAVAFVATVYGVGSANLVLLPIAKKLTRRLERDLAVREMVLEGVIGIQSGMNPHYLRERLAGFVEGRDRVRQGQS